MTEQSRLTREYDNKETVETPDGTIRPRRQGFDRGSPYADNVPGVGIDEPENPPDITEQTLQYDKDCCQGCGAGSHHEHTPDEGPSKRARRVFGDNQNIIWRCFNCATFREMQQGASADNPVQYPSRQPDAGSAGEARADGGEHQ